MNKSISTIVEIVMALYVRIALNAIASLGYA